MKVMSWSIVHLRLVACKMDCMGCCRVIKGTPSTAEDGESELLASCLKSHPCKLDVKLWHCETRKSFLLSETHGKLDEAVR